MPRTHTTPAQVKQTSFGDQMGMTTAACVPAVRLAVEAWRTGGYKEATDTTRELLAHWFKRDHLLPTRRPFAYHPFQREAIETLIYLWEVAAIRSRAALLEHYAHDSKLPLPQYDDFARYAVKMATGSGKTKVMALAVAWQYLNAAREDDTLYAKTFLLIAPNIIVFERLRSDFAGGKIFRFDPVIPPTLKPFWELDCVLRGDGGRVPADGMLFLTNIQQLYVKAAGDGGEPDALTAVLGPKPPAQLQEGADFRERITSRPGPLLVINDEAHHTHEEGSEWNGVIRSLHAQRPIAAQLDFSATPRFQKGGLFPWVVFDYPLKQAIFDNIVKRPVKGVASIAEAPSDIASIRYQGFLVAGVNRWQEYQEQLAPLAKKPILFVMMNSTDEADDVGDWLRTKYPSDFGGDRLLVIHTNSSGDITKGDLEAARKVAREVDEAGSSVNAIVSVLMLREGWDVQNVTVIVGLRPYTSKANILPEQTIGRGLRLMFRGDGGGYTERVDVIGNKTFISFVEDLERIENLKLDTFEVGKDKLQIQTIAPVAEKSAYDIGLPILTPALLRKHTLAEEIAALDVQTFPLPQPLPLKPGDRSAQSFTYEGFDILTLEKMVERQYTIPDPQTSGEIIGFYAKVIATNLKLPSQFAALVPQIRAFFAGKAFGQAVDLEQPDILKAMGSKVALYVVPKVFESALKDVLVEAAAPTLVTPARMLSECPPFPFSRPTTYAAKHCVLNLVPSENELERDFARFLDDAPDVRAFAKLPDPFGFVIDYIDPGANMRYYRPDFVAVTDDGTHWLIETKGAETVEVVHKDRAATLWCENATALTGTPWRYLKVPQKEFQKLQPGDFSDLLALI
ncbi:MAG: DEAD/DEAH box helicase family protein [Chloroflexota bacterium]|nr:DEAD/DEAH box helicase family protein [Chloroflexota bacterium]